MDFCNFKELEHAIQNKQYDSNREIPIFDGRISCGFGILPVRVLDYSNTNAMNNIDEMQSLEISVVDMDVFQYLEPFLLKHFDAELAANKIRVDYTWIDNDGNEHIESVKTLWGCYDDCFFTLTSMKDILKDIKKVVEVMAFGGENELIDRLVFDEDITQEQIHEIKASMPRALKAEKEMIIDFYRRVCSKMENMLKIAKENGYDLILFMSP